MNIVLLGFTEKDANAITILCNMLAKDILCSHILLHDDQETHYQLQRQPYDVAIIFVDSVQHHLDLKRTILINMQDKPVILISRYLEDLRDEPWVNLHAQAHIQFPYTRQTMLEPIKKVYQLHQAGTLDSHLSIGYNPTPATHGDQYIVQQNFNTDLLQRHYPDLAKKKWVVQFFNLPHQQQCAELAIGPYQLLANPTEKSLISLRTLQWTLDYLRVSHDEGLNIPFDSKLIDSNQAMILGDQMLASNGNKQSLVMSIWQLSMVWLEQMASFDTKAIAKTPFKVYAIPNLSELHPAEPQLHGVFSACLVQARTLEQLQILFPQIDEARLHRIILASVIANIGTFQPNSNQNQNSNKGIEQANQTGFLQRLLSKLGFKSQ